MILSVVTSNILKIKRLNMCFNMYVILFAFFVHLQAKIFAFSMMSNFNHQMNALLQKSDKF